VSSLSAITSLGAPATVSGLATGLNSDQIIQGLLAVQREQNPTSQNKQKTVSDQQTSFKGIEAKLFGLASQSQLPHSNAEWRF